MQIISDYHSLNRGLACTRQVPVHMQLQVHAIRLTMPAQHVAMNAWTMHAWHGFEATSFEAMSFAR